MALTAAQYRDKAEEAANSARTSSNAGQQETAVARSQIASVWAYLYVEQAKLDAAAV